MDHEDMPEIHPRLECHWQCTEEELADAYHGRSIPEKLGYPDMQSCVVHAILTNSDHGTELRDVDPRFGRALNARLIVDGIIPSTEMMNADDNTIPYCFWYPHVASEDTYRELFCQHPHLRYSIARACAVAGYDPLYGELGCLPEVSVAEEAQASSEPGSKIIFNSIVTSPLRYRVLNDYKRRVLAQPELSMTGLNDDTCVRWMLDRRRPYCVPEELLDTYKSLHRGYFDLLEDEHVSDRLIDDLWGRYYEDYMPQLLACPLPRDLPKGNKDLLILCAAFNGDIDRYSRLRGENHWIISEKHCVIYGLYHSTAFAKWMSTQGVEDRLALRAIHARFIMNNDLSYITDKTDKCDLPYLIWYPNVPEKETLRKLAQMKPCMKSQISRACIFADFQDLYTELNARPDRDQLQEAQDSPNPFYLKDIMARGDALELYLEEEEPVHYGLFARYRSRYRSSKGTGIPETLNPLSAAGWNSKLYDHFGVDINKVDRWITAQLPHALRDRALRY